MIVVEKYKGVAVTEHRVEVVERKGTGHPDFICDSLMEAISVALSKVYTENFGTVLHFNIDKGLLAAGATVKTFGGGRMTKPMELTIGDRTPIDKPQMASAQVLMDRRLRLKDVSKRISAIVERELSTINTFCGDLSKGKYQIC